MPVPPDGSRRSFRILSQASLAPNHYQELSRQRGAAIDPAQLSKRLTKCDDLHPSLRVESRYNRAGNPSVARARGGLDVSAKEPSVCIVGSAP